MQIRIGAPVYSSDGTRMGIVGRVVIDPRTEDLTDLLLQQDESDPLGTIVPLSLVAAADEAAVRLRISAPEVAKLPEGPTIAYVPLESVERGPLVGWEGPPDYTCKEILVPAEILYDVPVRPFAPHIVQEGGLLGMSHPDISDETEVRCDEQVVGYVVEVLTVPDSTDVYGLAVRPTQPGQPMRLVPATAIGEVAPDHVRLCVDCAQFEQFPVYERMRR